jgi:hypothetical protein
LYHWGGVLQTRLLCSSLHFLSYSESLPITADCLHDRLNAGLRLILEDPVFIPCPRPVRCLRPGWRQAIWMHICIEEIANTASRISGKHSRLILHVI